MIWSQLKFQTQKEHELKLANRKVKRLKLINKNIRIKSTSYVKYKDY